MFQPQTKHCTTCHKLDPETDDDGYTTCCLDTVCEVDADGHCDRCNPKCVLCGFEIIDGYDLDQRKGGPVHPMRQCPKGTEKKVRRNASRPRKSPERVLAESAGIVVKEMKVVAPRGAHAECDHASTKAARAACRRKRAAAGE